MSGYNAIDFPDPEILTNKILCLYSSKFSVSGFQRVIASISKYLNDYTYTDHLGRMFERKVSAFR